MDKALPNVETEIKTPSDEEVADSQNKQTGRRTSWS